MAVYKNRCPARERRALDRSPYRSPAMRLLDSGQPSRAQVTERISHARQTGKSY